MRAPSLRCDQRCDCRTCCRSLRLLCRLSVLPFLFCYSALISFFRSLCCLAPHRTSSFTFRLELLPGSLKLEAALFRDLEICIDNARKWTGGQVHVRILARNHHRRSSSLTTWMRLSASALNPRVFGGHHVICHLEDSGLQEEAKD